MAEEDKINNQNIVIMIAVVIILSIFLNPLDFGNKGEYKRCVEICASDGERCIYNAGTFEERYNLGCIDRDEAISCVGELEYCITRCG